MGSLQVLREVSSTTKERTVTLRELLNSNEICQPGRAAFVNAWVVGSESTFPHPRKFTYRACNYQLGHGLCRKSLELGDKCGHGVQLSQCLHIFRAQLLIPSQEFNIRQPVEVPRRPPQQRWTIDEVMPLIEAKRIEAKKEALLGKCDKSTIAEMKWAIISEDLKAQGVNRFGKILKKKWDQMMEFFKKVYDWQQRTPSGQLGFFQMPSHERKERNLPATFLESWYDTMGTFVEKSRAINSGWDRVVDASDVDFPTPIDDEEETILIDSYQGNAPPSSPLSFEGHQEVPTPDTQQNSPTHSHSIDFENMGRRKKKAHNGSQAKASNGVRDLIDTIASETRRHNDHEHAMIILEKLKHSKAMHIHNRALLLEESHSLQICGVLPEVGIALRKMTQELSQKRG